MKGIVKRTKQTDESADADWPRKIIKADVAKISPRSVAQVTGSKQCHQPRQEAQEEGHMCARENMGGEKGEKTRVCLESSSFKCQWGPRSSSWNFKKQVRLEMQLVNYR